VLSQDQYDTLTGRTVYDRNGDKIGDIGQVWTDRDAEPTWASVKTGLFGLRESLVPLEAAEADGENLRIPFEKSHVKDAPHIDVSHDEPLTYGEVDRLYQHYGLSGGYGNSGYESSSARTGGYEGGAQAGGYEGGTRAGGYEGSTQAGGYESSSAQAGGYGVGEAREARTGGRQGDDDAMTRSEERLNVETRAEEAGRARLRKYVVTERQQVDVPVQREEVRLEREPITEANRGDAVDGPAITESEHEVTLRAERPVVETEAVPVERVRLGKETVTDQETVGGEVRKERIEADVPGDQGRRQIR
jgi:uncharacterized protein (TIGR02271 family)